MNKKCGFSDTVCRGLRLSLLASLAALAACGSLKPTGPSTARDDENKRGKITDWLLSGGSQVGNIRFGSGEGEALVGDVNKHLWRATLDTLSFLPIESTDPYSGVIATDWAAVAGAPEQRIKVTAYITSRELDARALRVAVHQERLVRGAWTPAAAAPETAEKVEDAILVRARQLKIAEKEEG